MPADAKVSVPGLALAALTRSATVLKPLLTDATRMFGEVPSRTTWTKSLLGSYGSLLCSTLSVAIDEELVAIV